MQQHPPHCDSNFVRGSSDKAVAFCRNDTALQARLSALPEELDTYLLNIILQSADRLVYLNRMVWRVMDSNQDFNDRIDMADAFVHLLEEHGGPLKGKELKERLMAIRGVPKTMQIQPTERMIQIGPDFRGVGRP